MLEREMFEAYVKQADAVTFGGKPLLTWDELGEDSQICWKAAASVCADEIERLRERLHNPTPEMIAAAWGAWHERHGGKLGPGPAFVEAMKAMAHAALKEGE